MKVLDLFSGIGGFSLGLESAGMETIAFCEIDTFCKKVLSKHWPTVPQALDIRNLTYREGVLYDSEKPIYRGRIDVVCGGFPCQPFSIAGKKKGTDDHRDLWPEMFRVIREVKPTWVIGENVAHFVKMALERTAVDLESEGFAVQSFVIPACAVQAPHRRDRLWIVANAQSPGLPGVCEGQQRKDHKQQRSEGQPDDRNEIRSKAGSDGLCVSTPNSNGHAAGSPRANNTPNRKATTAVYEDNERRSEQKFLGKGQSSLSCAFSKFQDAREIKDYFTNPSLPKPLIRRGGDGLYNRVDRTKAIGNAAVPQVVEEIGLAILEEKR